MNDDDDEWNVYILIHHHHASSPPAIASSSFALARTVAIVTPSRYRVSGRGADEKARRTEANKADATPTAATDLDTLAENSCTFARAADTLTLEL